MVAHYLELIQEVEPIFKEHPPIKNVLSFTPASYIQYGSKYPICGIAQTPANYGAKRMTPQVAQNVFICGNSVFAGGLWGAVAGAWQGFCTFYRKRFGIEIGNRDILYKPGLKNLPQKILNGRDKSRPYIQSHCNELRDVVCTGSIYRTHAYIVFY